MTRSICVSVMRSFASLGFLGALFVFTSHAALAQSYPDRVIKVVVAWPAGGIADITTRAVTTHLSARLKQPVIIEIRTGANGIIGADSVAKAAPDGYTLLFASAEANCINPHIYDKLPYDPAKDFAAISPFIKVHAALAARVNLPASTAREAIELARSQPGKLTYGSWGIGSIGHIGMAMVIDQSGINILHVPYNGGPPTFTAIMGGQIDFMLIPSPAAIPFRRGGKIKVFGVTSPERFSLMADVPTMKEQGYDIDATNTFGFVAPAKTPVAILDKLHYEINEILKMPEVQNIMKAQGAEVFTMSRQEYAKYLVRESERWGAVIRKANIRVQK